MTVPVELALLDQLDDGGPVTISGPMLMALVQEHRLSREVYGKPTGGDVRACCFEAARSTHQLVEAMLREPS